MSKWRNSSSTRTYAAWRHMKYRCYNERDHSYPRYGGRGITVCGEWKDNYDQFCDDMGECPPDLTLERLDNDLGYFPANCVWATHTEQQNNRRSCRYITFNNKTQTLAQWAREVGIHEDTLRVRLRTLPIEAALRPGRTNASPPLEHGTSAAYGFHKCRCNVCRAFNTKRAAGYRKAVRDKT